MNLEKDSRQAFNMKRLTRNVQGRNGEDGTTTARGPRALQFGDSTARYLHNRHRALQSEVGTERTAGPAVPTNDWWARRIYPTPPILRNEASCNVGKNRAKWLV